MSGPGTELKRLLRKLGITPQRGCKCDSRAQIMDEMGSDWCEKNVRIVVNWLKEGARVEGYPFVRPIAYLLISVAIRRARRYEQTRPTGTSAQTKDRG